MIDALAPQPISTEEVQSTSYVFYTCLFAVIILAVTHFYQHSTRFWKLGNKIPGPTPFPFLGNVPELVKLAPKFIASDIFKFALAYHKQFGNTVRVWIGNQLLVFLMEPADVELILGSSEHIDKSPEYRFFQPWLRDGLLISTGEKWRNHRRLIVPAFHQNVLKSFVPTFNKNSRQVVKSLEKELHREFNVHDYMNSATVNILLETAMGIKKEDHPNGAHYGEAVMGLCRILHYRHVKVWFRLDTLFNMTKTALKQTKLLNIVHGLSSSVIKDKQAKYIENRIKNKDPNYFTQLDEEAIKSDALDQEIRAGEYRDEKRIGAILRDDLDDHDENDIGAKKRLAFLDLLIETSYSNKNFKDEEIQEEVDTIMFEGHDTTSAGSSFALCMLGIHQHVQQKVYQELYDIFGDSDRECTFADTVEMKYLERVILETIRMYPPVPVIARKVNVDVPLASSNNVIPAGATVVIGIFPMHRRADLYPNPLEFNPDNFLPENTSKRHYYSFIPFSAGPRSCVGRKFAMLKLKILLSTILRNYKMVSNLTENDFELCGDIILKRDDGFRLNIEPRKRVPPFPKAAKVPA